MFTKSLAVTIILLNFYIAKCKIVPKVVGGKPVDISHYPHSAFININKYDGSFVCGASILNQRVLLTAGHCITPPYRESFVYTGDSRKRRGARYSIAAFKLHEYYRDDTVGYDIGLVLVKERIIFSNVVQRVALLRRPPISKKAAIAGWGMISEDPVQDTNTLQHAELNVWSHEKCRKYIRDLPIGDLCAGSLDKRQPYAAYGDSGSALIIKNYIQIGVVSFKTNLIDSLAAFSNVTYYYNWITRNAKLLHCNVG